MTRGMLAVLGNVLIVAIAEPAFAQKAGAAGVLLRGSSIGILWHVSDNVALRPEIAISKASSTTSSGAAETTTDSWAANFGSSAHFYVAHWNAVRAYLSPQYHYMHGKATSTGVPSSSSSSTHSVSGMFGTQYVVSDRFSIFGELGAQYAWQPKWSTSATTTARSWQLDTKTSIGVVIYF